MTNSLSSAIADMTEKGHRIRWDHFDILTTGQSNIRCKIKEILLIRDSSLLAIYIFPADLARSVGLSFTFSLSLLPLFCISLCA